MNGVQPEIWDPESGRISPVALYDTSDGMTRIPLVLPPKASVFVVFRNGPLPRSNETVRSISRDGKMLLMAGARQAPPQVEILSAVYGKPGTPGHTRDAKADIQKLVENGETSFPVIKIAAMGGDPNPNVVKTLDLHYRINGKDEQVLLHDGDVVDFSAPRESSPALNAAGRPAPPKIEILSATYGKSAAPAHTRDARVDIQKLVDGGETSFPVVKIAMIGGDPDVNVFKTLDLHYRINGKEEHALLHDGDVVDFSVIGENPPATVETGANGKIHLFAAEPGNYSCLLASGETVTVTVSDVPEPVNLQGPWTVKFPDGWGAPSQVLLETLIPLNEHSDAGVRYFSGTASYHCEFDVPANRLAAGHRIELDLGDVAVMAGVTLNGQALGILWKPPFRLDVTASLRAGRNTLEIAVANLWVNRLIGDQQLPSDVERTRNGTLASWPPWLLEGKPSPTGRFTFTTWELWHKSDPLVASGLIGPVQLRTAVCQQIS
jgi:hypothetical protein